MHFNQNKQLVSKVKRCLINNFNCNNVIGFIPLELIYLWEQEKLDQRELPKLGKYMLIAMQKIWKFRCNYNRVKYEKSIPIQEQTVENFVDKKESKEIFDIISAELTRDKIHYEGSYW